MKRSLSCLLFAMLLVSCGGGDDGAGPGGGNNNTDPTPTTPGTPNGTPTTQSIGPAGGTLTSSDGLFSVTIPAGALPAATSGAGGETEITIQPITNTAWGGVGSGYRLLPDGLTFSAPVELNFSLEDSLLWGSDTLFVDTARQEDNGTWGILKNRHLDWDTRTLTCTTSHFSDYSMIEGLQIRPVAASIGVMATVNLNVKYCHQQTVSGDPDLVGFVYSCDEDLAPIGTFSSWSVNGVAGGNATIGTVAKTSPSGATARYTAPASVPNPNPVAVSVLAKGRRGTTMLVSNITIGGLWYGTVVMTEGNAKSEATVVWQQVATFQGIETYRPLSGTVHYTPETDYGPVCSFVSMDPRDADIQSEFGTMIINFNFQPPMVSGYGMTDPNTDLATTCFTCDGWDQPECNIGQLPGWFAADSMAVSQSGDAISYQATDNGALPPRSITVDFHKGLPPVSLVVKH